MSLFLDKTRAAFRKLADAVSSRKSTAERNKFTAPRESYLIPLPKPKIKPDPYILPAAFALMRLSAFKNSRNDAGKRKELDVLDAYLAYHQEAYTLSIPGSPTFLMVSEAFILAALRELKSDIADSMLYLSLQTTLRETDHAPTQQYFDDTVDFLRMRCLHPFSEPLKYPLPALQKSQELVTRNPSLITSAYVEMCCLYASIEPEELPKQRGNLKENPHITAARERITKNNAEIIKAHNTARNNITCVLDLSRDGVLKYSAYELFSKHSIAALEKVSLQKFPAGNAGPIMKIIADIEQHMKNQASPPSDAWLGGGKPKGINPPS